jgi:excisionase family DNA binding protein
MKAALSPRAAARFYNLSDRTLRRWIAEKRVSVHACGRKSLILLSDLEAVIREQPAPRSSRRSFNEAANVGA